MYPEWRCPILERWVWSSERSANFKCKLIYTDKCRNEILCHNFSMEGLFFRKKLGKITANNSETFPAKMLIKMR